MKYNLLFFFFFISSLPLTAQKFIQMEKYGSAKVKKYYIGDELTYKIKEFGDDWLTETIEDIHMQDNLVQFKNRVIKLNDIIAIRSFQRSRWSKPIGQKLYLFGISWGVFSLLSPLAGLPITWAAAIVPGVAFTTGFLLQVIFKHRTYKLGKGKRRWLRMLDMNQVQRIGP